MKVIAGFLVMLSLPGLAAAQQADGVPSLEELERQLEQKKAERKPRSRFEVVADGVRDRTEGVIWAARDNGQNIDWNGAVAYCAGLGAGWGLPSVAELQSLYDATGTFTRKVRLSDGSTWSIRPATDRIGLTGVFYWSAERQGSALAWYVNLYYGIRASNPVSNTSLFRALCVRRS